MWIGVLVTGSEGSEDGRACGLGASVAGEWVSTVLLAFFIASETAARDFFILSLTIPPGKGSLEASSLCKVGPGDRSVESVQAVIRNACVLDPTSVSAESQDGTREVGVLHTGQSLGR